MDKAKAARAAEIIKDGLDELTEALSYAPERRDPADIVKSAIECEVAISFAYRDRNGAVSERVLSPFEVRDLGAIAPDEIVVGWDHGRDAIRQFHVERMTALAAADESYVHPE